jgi:hypothetical protein
MVDLRGESEYASDWMCINSQSVADEVIENESQCEKPDEQTV